MRPLTESEARPETEAGWRPTGPGRRYCQGGPGRGRIGCGLWATVEHYEEAAQNRTRNEVRARWSRGERDYVALAYHLHVSPRTVHRWTQDLRGGFPCPPTRGRWVALCVAHSHGRFTLDGRVVRWHTLDG